eukprot:CAMPEP_0181405994 /NCGR_PEP_ID=MMETSP1110-20121109/5044_1 /TAXON_ID=174948 /ORGANISM="Symbiodinium sp., Strain CCMP421" /LENGTH=156 /DNA_ID=CAMNT_0023528395 /DNA_START=2986 /DNA_END=3456 /DNA_ORIENTATION=+
MPLFPLCLSQRLIIDERGKEGDRQAKIQGKEKPGKEEGHPLIPFLSIRSYWITANLSPLVPKVGDGSIWPSPSIPFLTFFRFSRTLTHLFVPNCRIHVMAVNWMSHYTAAKEESKGKDKRLILTSHSIPSITSPTPSQSEGQGQRTESWGDREGKD